MIRKLIISACSILLSLTAWPQDKNAELPAKNFKFAPTIELGISHRNASIELESSFLASRRNFGFDYNQLAITRTQSLTIDMRQNLYKERIFAQLSTYFRYNHFHYEGDFTTKEIKSFKSDLFLDAIFSSNKKKRTSVGFLLGAGIGFMNIGTRFHYNYNTGIKDSSGNWISKRAKGTFSFLAPRLLIGIQKKRLSGFINVHYTPDDYYRPNPSIWLEFKAAYSFSLAKKNAITKNEELPTKKFKFNPSVEIGIAFRPVVIELSELSRLPNLGPPYTTYAYNATKHFHNLNLAIALQHYVFKKRISLQVASYFRYNHLYYGKNAQGLSSLNEKEYKRLKYDVFIDGMYHFKKRKPGSVGILLGVGIGNMNYGTRFMDSAWRGNDYVEVVKGFRFMAPRLIVGLNKNKFSFFTIAHGTPDADYEGNPSIWLEFKAAYSFSPFKMNK